MDSKPLITYAGDQKLFSTLEAAISEGLPEESAQWKRPYGRGPKLVYVTANFVQFSEDSIPKESNMKLLGQPFFHTYWTECSDVESYKHNVREDINLWMSKLKSKNIHDWLIVVVDYSDSKRSNKKLLPRTTVLDKIKNDFPSKNSERCVSLLDPCKADGRATESWQTLLRRLRQLLLQAYSRQLSIYEEHMRTRREKRKELGWNFRDFFFLQEELAFVYEMLGLYDEALVQYDELDALFTQFVINSNVGGMPDWLTSFTQICNSWAGLCLLREVALSLREIIKKDQGSLLEFRNYLFSRQCNLLLLLCRPWEVAQRTLPFLYNTVGELRILEVEMSPGSLASWVILSCLEVLQTCERFSDSTQMESYSLYTASLWEYTRQKGIDPAGATNGVLKYMINPNDEAKDIPPDVNAIIPVQGLLSIQLLYKQVSIEKIAIANIAIGIRGNIRLTTEDNSCSINVLVEDTEINSPQAKLRESLSSKDGFLKHYLEISELTMGTFKHIGRIRTARFIGRDLAQLYIYLVIAVNYMLPYENILNPSDELEKILESWLHFTSSLLIIGYFNARIENECDTNCILVYSKLLESDRLLMNIEELFAVTNIQIFCSDEIIICGSELELIVNIKNNFPQTINCQNIKVSLKQENISASETVSQTHLAPGSKSLTPSPTSPTCEMLRDEIHAFSPLQLTIEYDYKQDGTLDSSGIICKNTQQFLQRRDSHNTLREKELEKKYDDDLNFVITNVDLINGENKIKLKTKIEKAGVFVLQQLNIEWGNIHFILSRIMPYMTFKVIYEPANIKLHSKQGGLLAGVEQTLILSISSGSNFISEGTLLHLKASLGVLLKVDDNKDDKNFVEETDVPLPAILPFQTICVSLQILAHLGPQKDANTVEHKITIYWQKALQPFSVPLHFLPPFLSVHKLHTCGVRKYLQVAVHGLSDNPIELCDPILKATDVTDVELKLLNPNQTLVVNAEQAAYYLWEIIQDEAETFPVNFLFNIHYKRKDYSTDPLRKYQCDFHLNCYMTLYTVRASIEPPKGSEFCRAGTMCQMHITIIQMQPSTHSFLMYEVVTDQTWAVCGKTAGVINVDSSGRHNVTLDAMPLTSGFLPLPTVRLSKYIPSEQKSANKDTGQQIKSSGQNTAKLEPFDPGQVYSWSRATQLHVLPASSGSTNLEMCAS
ncbi:trafficking protein particle complex subunit 10-like [Centruroides sculpturatus]|uniref:trafficking protein particle complex subunit 10-like n=1 Tax=Centruroides sculpturatus TaxID=218467 RepID=UPI000C6E4727|nr:trafficking protein particle complex subunit 10-like [Centruroides sculpturatus]